MAGNREIPKPACQRARHVESTHQDAGRRSIEQAAGVWQHLCLQPWPFGGEVFLIPVGPNRAFLLEHHGLLILQESSATLSDGCMDRQRPEYETSGRSEAGVHVRKRWSNQSSHASCNAAVSPSPVVAESSKECLRVMTKAMHSIDFDADPALRRRFAELLNLAL